METRCIKSFGGIDEEQVSGETWAGTHEEEASTAPPKSMFSQAHSQETLPHIIHDRQHVKLTIHASSLNHNTTHLVSIRLSVDKIGFKDWTKNLDVIKKRRFLKSKI